MAPHAAQPVSKPWPQGPAKGCGNMMQRIGLVAPAPQPPAHRLCTILCKSMFSSGVGGALFKRIIKAYRIVGPGDGGDDCAEALLAMMATMATMTIMAMPRW